MNESTKGQSMARQKGLIGRAGDALVTTGLTWAAGKIVNVTAHRIENGISRRITSAIVDGGARKKDTARSRARERGRAARKGGVR